MPYKARTCVVCAGEFFPNRGGDLGHTKCLKQPGRSVSEDLKVVQEWEGRPYSDPRNDKKQRAKDQSPLRVCVFDIEATALNASFGRVLCAVAQFFGPDEEKVWRADDYEPWQRGKRGDDSHLVGAILQGLEDADIIIAHNGTQYDMPFLRTRALVAGLPPVHPMKIVDPVMLARRQFRFHSNRLDSIAKAMGTTNQKTDLDPNLWVAAWADGDKAALDQIVYHCRQDVQTLADFAWGARKYIKAIDSIGSFRG